MIPSESSANLQTTEAATHSYDGFLYQCRVSRKISARVGGNRNGRSNSFRHTLSFVVVLSGQRVSSRWHNQRYVPVLITRTFIGSKASTKPTRRIPTRSIFG